MLTTNNIEPTQIFVEENGQRTELTVLQTEKGSQIVGNWSTPFSISASIGSYTTVTINRTASQYANAPLGVISTTSRIYLGDILQITFGTSGSDYDLTTRRITMGGQTVTSPVTVTGDITILSKASWWHKQNSRTQTFLSTVNLSVETSGRSESTFISSSTVGVSDFDLPTRFVGNYSGAGSGKFDVSIADDLFIETDLYTTTRPGYSLVCYTNKEGTTPTLQKYVFYCTATAQTLVKTPIQVRTQITDVLQYYEGD